MGSQSFERRGGERMLGLGLSLLDPGLVWSRGGVPLLLYVDAASLRFCSPVAHLLSGDGEKEHGSGSRRSRPFSTALGRGPGFLFGIESGVLDSSIGSSKVGPRGLEKAAATRSGDRLIFLSPRPTTRAAGSLAAASSGFGLAFGCGESSGSERSERSSESRMLPVRRWGLSRRARLSVWASKLVASLVTSLSTVSDGRLRGFGGAWRRGFAAGRSGLDEMRLMTSPTIVSCGGGMGCLARPWA